MNDIEEFCPSNPEDWRKWLEANHEHKDAVWIIFYRKKSPTPNLNWSESAANASIKKSKL